MSEINETDALPYERQLEEPLKHFEWFYTFLMVGPGRSLTGAYNLFHGRRAEKSGQVWTNKSDASDSWKNACQKWQWKARAEEWDKEQRRLAEKKWDERRDQVQERAWGFAEILFAKAELMAKFPLQKTTSASNGKTVIVEPANWTFDTMARIGDKANEMARLACSLETQRIKVDVDELDEDQALAEAIATLESLGYQVIAPDQAEDEDEDG